VFTTCWAACSPHSTTSRLETMLSSTTPSSWRRYRAIRTMPTAPSVTWTTS